ncbi:hypothetical protein DESC_590068 [Desulfosarcina cetonica]|nr:hypothetical protein DESC_590068 [Desulfosarcina cetonica]
MGVSLGGQDLGDVPDLNGMVVAREVALDVHQADHVAADHGLGARGEDIGDLLGDHGRGDVRVFHRESAAESAAAVGINHFHQFQAVHAGQKLARLMAHAEGAHEVAGVVIGDPSRPAGPQIGHAQDVHEKFGQFEGLGGHGRGPRPPGRFIGKQLGVVMAHHGHAGARRTDDAGCIFEDFDEVPGRLAGRVPVTGIEGRLAAAGLAVGVVHDDGQAFEDPQHRLGHFRIDAVDDALDEQADPLGALRNCFWHGAILFGNAVDQWINNAGSVVNRDGKRMQSTMAST